MPPPPDATAAAVPAALPLQWLERYGDGLYAYALRRVRRPEAAEDLVQETLLAGVRAWPGFAGRADVRTWLTAILRNKVADHLRVRYREGAADVLDDDALFDDRGRWRTAVPAWHGDPADLAERREFRAVLDGCLAALPERTAHLFLSRVADGVPTAELCGELGIEPAHAWTLLSRARARLRLCLTERWFAADDDNSGPGRRTT